MDKAQKTEIPIWEKANLTVEEAAAYFGIGINKIRELSNSPHCDFVLWVGSRRLIKRKNLKSLLNILSRYEEKRYAQDTTSQKQCTI